MPAQNRPLLLANLVLILALVVTNLVWWNRTRGLDQEIVMTRSEIADLQEEIEGLSEATTTAATESRETTNRLNALFIAAGLALEDVAEQLESLETQEFTLMVPIDERIEVQATIPFDESLDVPINTTVPIDTSVTVPLDLGPLGNRSFDVPIQASVPLDFTVPVRIETEVPVDTVVPITLDVPVTLTLRDTPLAEELAAWRGEILRLLASLRVESREP